MCRCMFRCLLQNSQLTFSKASFYAQSESEFIFSSHFCAFCIPWQSLSACAALSLTGCEHSHSQENDDETAKREPMTKQREVLGSLEEKERKLGEEIIQRMRAISLWVVFFLFMYSRHMYVCPRGGVLCLCLLFCISLLLFVVIIQRLFLPPPTPCCLHRKLLNLLSPPFVSPPPCSLHSTLPCNLSVLCR